MILKKPYTLLSFSLLIFPLVTSVYSSTKNQSPSPTIRLKIVGINDFHGQISTGRLEGKAEVGGATVLASYLKEAQSSMAENTIITIMGDLVGASPPASALLHDEPTILFINSLGNNHCTSQERMNPECNIVATLGNHEFDKGQQALLDLIYGAGKPPINNWYPMAEYQGAAYPYISANILNAETNKPMFPPYIIKQVHGIPIAFIGAIVKNTPEMSFPAHIKGLKFIDEAEAINSYLPEIKAQGVNIIIVLIHEGGEQKPYEGPTQQDTEVHGAIKEIIYRLNDEVDVVMAGHTHQFMNAFLPNHHGKQVLVTQANSYSSSYAEVSLDVDEKNHHLVKKEARIITTFANQWPGTTPDPQTQYLVDLAENKVAPIIQEPIGSAYYPLLRKQNAAGESNLGNLVADAFKKAMNADLAVHNIHGLRADIPAGAITKGAVYSALPFANTVVLVSLTGQDIYDLLEQQWQGSYPNMLQISGITYTYDTKQPLGKRIQGIELFNGPLLREKVYTIATTDFFANGSGVFSVMKKSKMLKQGDSDCQVLIDYIKQGAQPIKIEIEDRIKST
ncbi:bifunctional UDP-sugar hydrolase/5'-nucleotidase [Legionella sp. km772]|uniref:bifunctional metallophosphatase/5'-nucleotidase n=1 Tax=Legionella sp. km772 TaxID=2498111 RepID=UPI000F8E3FB4|nr:bifunctional metallophosphatase/5'-nucleotidase [Legionella sp. km772]RUR13666.1 bifunctional metallophosphatase/5'-nucleotidase [Legionella sp. km772]